MQKQSSDKLISLEICRFIAAFCVMINHQVSSITTQYPHAGSLLSGFDLPPITPVLFFFVLSGFVMMTAHIDDFNDITQLPRYFWRRFCRIFPIYWLSLAIYLYFLWPLLSRHEIFRMVTLWPFQPNLQELNPPAWSLRFEIAFYLMFGIGLLPVIGRYFLAAWAIIVTWHWLSRFFPHHFGVQYPFPQRIDWHFFGVNEFYFFAGLLAGFCFVKYRWPKKLYWTLLALGAVWLAVFSADAKWGFDYPSVPNVPLAALSLGTVILALSALERAGAFRLASSLSRLGAMSYPLYLFHAPVLFALTLVFYYHPSIRAAFSPTTLIPLLLAATLALTYFVTFFIDQPLQRLLRGTKKGK